MRVTDKQMFNWMQGRLATVRSEAAKAQVAASTGLRVQAPSDDPNASAQARRRSSEIALLDAAIRGADHSRYELTGADEALSQAGELVSRAKELALAHASTTMDARSRADAAAEVAKLREQLIAVGNTKSGDVYLFGGQRTGAPPFSSDGTFTGDDRARQLELFDGVRFDTSVTAERAFGTGSSTDAMATLSALQEALESDDVAGVRASLESLDTAERQILNGRATVGSSIDALELGRSVAERRSDAAKTEKAGLLEIDVTEAITDFTRTKSALETAIALASQLPLPGLASRK